MAFLANLKPRERNLVYATTAVVVLGLFLQFSEEGDGDLGLGLGADASELELKFEDYRSQLERAPEILRDYNQLEARLPRSEDGQRADLAFSNQLAQLCTDSGFQYPPIDATRISAIPDVEDYELLSATLRTEGTFEDTARLIRIFQNNGLILREMELNGTRDRDMLRARFTVSRIAPVPQEDIERRRRTARRS